MYRYQFSPTDPIPILHLLAIDRQVPRTLENRNSLSCCCSISPEIPHKSIGNVCNRLLCRIQYLGHTHCSLICNNSYLTDQKSQASSVLLHNSHNHHAQYSIPKANITSLKVSVYIGNFWPYRCRSDTAKIGPIPILVSVSVHHYQIYSISQCIGVSKRTC